MLPLHLFSVISIAYATCSCVSPFFLIPKTLRFFSPFFLTMESVEQIPNDLQCIAAYSGALLFLFHCNFLKLFSFTFNILKMSTLSALFLFFCTFAEKMHFFFSSLFFPLPFYTMVNPQFKSF